MHAEKRRASILSLLSAAQEPISATALAAHMGVSRQIIVGDIALLRAGGEAISATPRGYVLGHGFTGVQRMAACQHTSEEMGAELYTIVDAGGEVVDVIVEHPVYGQLTGPLRLRSRADVDSFLQRVQGAEPLSALTGGIHLHTLRAPDEAVMERVMQALSSAGFLLPDGPER